jgi:hypothetical protein
MERELQDIINSIHNAIDDNKIDIMNLLKKDCKEMYITFTIQPDELLTVNISADKLIKSSLYKEYRTGRIKQ